MNKGASDFGSEVFAAKNHKDSLSDLAVSKYLNYFGTCGDGVVKVHDLSDPKVLYFKLILGYMSHYHS